MKGNAKEVGLFEAKTHLSALIGRVEHGEEITITKRGVPAARLIPAAAQRRADPKAAAARIRELSRGVKLKGYTIRSLIEEGRL
jgi:prevent-host-death family protein